MTPDLKDGSFKKKSPTKTLKRTRLDQLCGGGGLPDQLQGRGVCDPVYFVAADGGRGMVCRWGLILSVRYLSPP